MSETNTVTQNNENTAAGDVLTRVIEVANPTPEEMAGIKEHIKVNFDFAVAVKPVTFNFKKSKDKDTGIETIRKPVDLAIPYPTVEGIVAILEGGGKPLELLLEVMEGAVNAQARELLYDGLDLTAATFPVDKLSWDFISNIPKVQRRGGGIPKDTWDAFAEDYLAVMPDATGKTIEQCTAMAKILSAKLTPVRTNKPVLQLVVQQLSIWAEKSENASEFEECLNFLLAKVDTFLNVSDSDLLANL